MEFIHLIREKQQELIRLYHLEQEQKDMGVMVFRKDAHNNAQVIYYPLESIRSTYIVQRLRAMVLAMEGNNELKLENRLIITLPQFDELPEGVDVPKVMYFCIMDGPSGRLFQLIPQSTEVDGKLYYYYQMIADPDPDELEKMENEKARGVRGDTWTIGPTENGKWFKQVCLLALGNEPLFKKFRCAREFREIIGNENESYGEQIAQALEARGLDELGDIRNFKYLDEIGGPDKYYYAEIGWEMSPTTLRYMNTAFDIADSFGGEDEGIDWFEDKKIIEVGGGYGGLCSVLHQAADLREYTLVEIEPVRGLAERYLTEANVINNESTVNVVTPQGVELESDDPELESAELTQGEDWDLLISEYAFCELNQTGMEFYYRNVFPRVKNCYLGMNIWEEARKNEILARLQEFFTTVEEHKVTPEHPQWKRYIIVCKK